MATKEKVDEAMQWYDKYANHYKNCAKTKADIIEKILQKNHIPYHSITFRVKERESFLHKCENDKYTEPIKEIMDLSGIRIIAYTNQDVHHICDVIRNEFDIDEENSMDKADLMEEDQVGYLSVHYIVRLKKERTDLPEYEEYQSMCSEIQVRTLLQHTWAEIEHDRNYKFAGVLPKEIKRRFYLAAGVLEWVDREFDALSKDIDAYVLQSKENVDKGNYDMLLDSKSLEQYMLQKFGDYAGVRTATNDVVVSNAIVQELQRFGFTTIKEIEQCMTEELLEMDTTYIGLLRSMMVCKDTEKYFKDAYKGDWKGTKRSKVAFWESKGATNVEQYLKEYGIIVTD